MTRTPATLLAALATALVVASCGTTDDTEQPATPAASAEDMTSEDMTGEDDMTTEVEEMTEDDMDEEETSAMAGMSGYVEHDTYAADPAAYDGGPVVLFFHADWCPDCRATDESLTTVGLPEGLTVVKVDFDERTDLRQTYGVTQQHTFVQVDADGEEIATWTGATTGEEILARTQGS
ncbi:thioredoxin family protein [uncultured Serinicoccus sp.]|uniref:thioredoxin family protein n=1 Tax=uncultured Serinicoccus sp. TaxID=735514 RepID=UPI00263954F0|nr:thioredoxin family protein [uncultured Serinicoccus sp.]